MWFHTDGFRPGLFALADLTNNSFTSHNVSLFSLRGMSPALLGHHYPACVFRVLVFKSRKRTATAVYRIPRLLLCVESFFAPTQKGAGFLLKRSRLHEAVDRLGARLAPLHLVPMNAKRIHHM